MLGLVSEIQKLERKVAALEKGNDAKMLRISDLEREVESYVTFNTARAC